MPEASASAARHWITLTVLCLGTFAVLLDSTIVNVALPSMITSLHASLDEALWIVNAYLLAFAALLILASRLGDLFGPRRLFVVRLTVFAISSALCGAAHDPVDGVHVQSQPDRSDDQCRNDEEKQEHLVPE